MYFRDRAQSSRPWHIPEHYSGCAFSPNSPAAREEPESPAAKAVPPPNPEACPLPPAEQKCPSPPNPARGLDSDRALLLGLILLLSGNEEDPDIVPLLALLFFWK